MKKALFLINDLGAGGAERQIFYLFRFGLIEKVFCLFTRVEYPIDRDKVVFLGRNKQSFPLSILRFIFSIHRLPGHPPIVSFLEISNFLNILTSVIFRKHRAVVSVRISPEFYKDRKWGSLYLWLIKTLFPLAECIVCNSHDSAGIMEELLQGNFKKIIVIPNAVDIEEIQQLKNAVPSFSYDPKLTYLCSMGRLSEQKNYVRWLKVFSSLQRQNSSLRAVIIGKGEQEKELLELCETLNLRVSSDMTLEADVYFPGFQKNPFLFLKDENCVFILPSLFEGLPNVILEAMACGLPVISSDCSTGPREILAPHGSETYGVLMPLLDSTEAENLWLKELSSLLRDQALLKSYGKKARERANAYSLTQIEKKWKEILGVFSLLPLFYYVS